MKYIVSFIFILVVVLFLASPTSAQSSFTRVRGNVYNIVSGIQGIGGLTVSVTCNGITRTGVTDSFGLYVVDYTLAECGQFAPVSSSVTFTGQNQSQTVFVSHNNRATMDYYFGATSVPEFGLITGVLTALGSGITYLGLKRKLSN